MISVPRRPWMMLLLMLSPVFPSNGIPDLTLLPSDITVDEGKFAVFDCRYSCEIKQSHTLFWIVGGQPLLQRTFLRGRTKRFIESSGLYVEAVDQSTCKSDGPERGRASELLRINATSAEYNKTAVQCVAYAKNAYDQSIFSSYSIMLINAPDSRKGSDFLMPQPTTSSSIPCPPLTITIPSPSPTENCRLTVTHTRVVTVSKEVQITLTVSPTSTPYPTE